MAKKEGITYSQQKFENIKHIDENGTEFWYARELQTALEYAQWRRFQESIVREYSGENKPTFRNGGNRQTGIQETALAA